VSDAVAAVFVIVSAAGMLMLDFLGVRLAGRAMWWLADRAQPLLRKRYRSQSQPEIYRRVRKSRS
jgi:uncharacterized membrane protein YecN with MAPEG domain